MNRRRFLSSTMLGGLGLSAIAARGAQAFTVEECAPTAGGVACQEVLRHHEVRAQLEAALAARGLNEEQRNAALAAATCPFCGQPLIG